MIPISKRSCGRNGVGTSFFKCFLSFFFLSFFFFFLGGGTLSARFTLTAFAMKYLRMMKKNEDTAVSSKNRRCSVSSLARPPKHYWSVSSLGQRRLASSAIASRTYSEASGFSVLPKHPLQVVVFRSVPSVTELGQCLRASDFYFPWNSVIYVVSQAVSVLIASRNYPVPRAKAAGRKDCNTPKLVSDNGICPHRAEKRVFLGMVFG